MITKILLFMSIFLIVKKIIIYQFSKQILKKISDESVFNFVEKISPNKK